MIRIALAYPIKPRKQARNLIDLERGNQLISTFNDSESTTDFYQYLMTIHYATLLGVIPVLRQVALFYHDKGTDAQDEGTDTQDTQVNRT